MKVVGNINKVVGSSYNTRIELLYFKLNVQVNIYSVMYYEGVELLGGIHHVTFYIISQYVIGLDFVFDNSCNAFSSNLEASVIS